MNIYLTCDTAGVLEIWIGLAPPTYNGEWTDGGRCRYLGKTGRLEVAKPGECREWDLGKATTVWEGKA